MAVRLSNDLGPEPRDGVRTRSTSGPEGPDLTVLNTLFAEAGPEAVAALGRAARLVTREVGDVLYSADRPARVGIVVSGLLRTVVPLRDGRRATLHYVQPGYVYGLPSIFFAVPLRVEVVRKATVLEIDPSAITLAAREHPRLGWLLSKQLAGAVLRVPAIVEEFGFKTVRQRVARHVLALAASDPVDGHLVAIATHQDLAESVGSARVVVSRCLQSLKTGGLIAMAPGRITIVDERGLRQLFE
jgi:CRP-like cAMP-binding protein